MADHEIDEDFLLASIGDKKEGKILPHKEERIDPEKTESVKTKGVIAGSKRKRSPTIGEYENDFLCRNEIRQRRSVYVSESVHQKVQQIVKQIAGNDVSVGGYIDNVLKHHLEKYKEDINTLYKQVRTDLIE